MVEIISQFLSGLVLVVGDTEFELALFGAQDDRLALHAADHVEGGLGFSAQGHLEEVLLQAGLDGAAQLGLDFEEAVGRAETVQALVRPLVVIIFDPKFDPLAGGVKAGELGADQELLPDRRPKAFDLAQSHGVVGPGLDVSDAVLFELGLEAAGAAPGGVLAAVIGEHLLGWFELADGHPIDLDDGLSGGTAEQIGAHQVARVIVEERDEIGIAATQAEGEDVRLPHLVGRGSLEESRTGDVTL